MNESDSGFLIIPNTGGKVRGGVYNTGRTLKIFFQQK